MNAVGMEEDSGCQISAHTYAHSTVGQCFHCTLSVSSEEVKRNELFGGCCCFSPGIRADWPTYFKSRTREVS